MYRNAGISAASASAIRLTCKTNTGLQQGAREGKSNNVLGHRFQARHHLHKVGRKKIPIKLYVLLFPLLSQNQFLIDSLKCTKHSYLCPWSRWKPMLWLSHLPCHSSRVSTRFFCTSVSGYSSVSSKVLASAIVLCTLLSHRQTSAIPKGKYLQCCHLKA